MKFYTREIRCYYIIIGDVKMDEYKSTLPPRSSRVAAKNKNSFGRELLSSVLYIVIIVGLFFVVQRYFYAPVMVDGDSMEETLSDGDYLLLNQFSEIERFDVVIFPSLDSDPSAPEGEEKLFVKRVIGMSGDTVEFQGDTLILNGEEVDEKYLDYTLDYNYASFSLETLFGVEKVPKGHYFVLGDNRSIGGSLDSREFGFVDSESVLGKVSLRYWPLSDFGTIEK